MTRAKRYDAIVIGSGQGGVPLAVALAGAGWRTAVIERDQPGGTCVNTGCTPTKTMIASARVAYLARRGPDYGVTTTGVRVAMDAVRQRKRDIVRRFRSGVRERLEHGDNLDLIAGAGRFVGHKEVEAQWSGGSCRLTAETIFINAGTRPRTLPLPGLGAVPHLDSSSVMELDVVPEHLIVLGGGYVGLEFAQMFRRFGSEVTIIERASRLAPREDPDICAALREIFGEDGIQLYFGANARRLEASAGSITASVETADGARRIDGSHLLIAVGRVPNSDSLNLDATGLSTDERGFIPVDERLRTAVPGIYALGDINGGPAFTHVSYDDYRILRANLIEGGNVTTTDRLVPYTVFTDPQLGRVGVTEEQAKAQGQRHAVATIPMSHVARALETDETRGLMKVIVDPASKQILGAAILGIEGGEVMSMIEVAMMGNLPYTALQSTLFAHPTLAEALNNLFAQLDR